MKKTNKKKKEKNKGKNRERNLRRKKTKTTTRRTKKMEKKNKREEENDDKKKKKKKRKRNKKKKKKKQDNKSDIKIMKIRKTNEFHIRFTTGCQPAFAAGGFPLSSSQFHYKTLFCLSYVPVHVFPLPVKPRLQLQLSQ